MLFYCIACWLFVLGMLAADYVNETAAQEDQWAAAAVFSFAFAFAPIWVPFFIGYALADIE